MNQFQLKQIIKEEIHKILSEEPSSDKNIGDIVNKIFVSNKNKNFTFDQTGNDELIEFASYILTPEGAKKVAQTIYSQLKKGEGAGENQNEFGIYTSNKQKLSDLERKLK